MKRHNPVNNISGTATSICLGVREECDRGWVCFFSHSVVSLHQFCFGAVPADSVREAPQQEGLNGSECLWDEFAPLWSKSTGKLQEKERPLRVPGKSSKGQASKVHPNIVDDKWKEEEDQFPDLRLSREPKYQAPQV